MKALKHSRNRNSLISVQRTAKFRDDLIVFGKREGKAVFLTFFNNIYVTYEIVSIPVKNGTYKIKVLSVDDLGNYNSGIESTVFVSFYPLPPKNLEISVSGNNVTLTWEHSVDGVPDNYKIYGNGGSGNIDKSGPMYTISGFLLTYTFAVSDGQWKFVVESIKGLSESNNLEYVDSAVPTSIAIPPSPGVTGSGPFAVTGLSLSNVSVGKVKISFYWPYGSQASSFNIYHDDGMGVIDYGVPKFSFVRQESFIQEYTTSKLHSLDENVTYKFVVRAVNQYSIEESNEDIYEIDVDGVAPSEIDSLALDTVF